MRTDVPKTIHTLWLQGVEQAPPIVRLNFERWATLNPDYRLNILDRTDAAAVLAGTGLSGLTLSPQALSDVVRARLLRDKGGVWVDASLFPVTPLSAWLPGVLAHSGFFAFERPGPDRPISSWFLAATGGHPILAGWWEEIERFWSEPRELMASTPTDPIAAVSADGARNSGVYPYFWLHYLFQLVIDTRPEAAAAWHKCTKLAAEPPHRLQVLFARDQHPTRHQMRRAVRSAPVQKLDWRVGYPVCELASLC